MAAPFFRISKSKKKKKLNTGRKKILFHSPIKMIYCKNEKLFISTLKQFNVGKKQLLNLFNK